MAHGVESLWPSNAYIFVDLRMLVYVVVLSQSGIQMNDLFKLCNLCEKQIIHFINNKMTKPDNCYSVECKLMSAPWSQNGHVTIITGTREYVIIEITRTCNYAIQHCLTNMSRIREMVDHDTPDCSLLILTVYLCTCVAGVAVVNDMTCLPHVRVQVFCVKIELL